MVFLMCLINKVVINLNISATQIANAIPVIAVTPATCTSDGVATITNYAASNTYVLILLDLH